MKMFHYTQAGLFPGTKIKKDLVCLKRNTGMQITFEVIKRKAWEHVIRCVEYRSRKVRKELKCDVKERIIVY
jgi:hypothetical protein